jgi:hypothetical protein
VRIITKTTNTPRNNYMNNYTTAIKERKTSRNKPGHASWRKKTKQQNWTLRTLSTENWKPHYDSSETSYIGQFHPCINWQPVLEWGFYVGKFFYSFSSKDSTKNILGWHPLFFSGSSQIFSCIATSTSAWSLRNLPRSALQVRTIAWYNPMSIGQNGQSLQRCDGVSG